MYNHPDGDNQLFFYWAEGLGKTWPNILPSFQDNTPSPLNVRVWWSVGLTVVAILFLILTLRSTRKADGDTAPRQKPGP
jgi:hypothetical protein